MTNHTLLAEAIEQKREELIRIVNQSGLSSNLAIRYSQELDRLLNEYNYKYYQKHTQQESSITGSR
ncbi:hypothetical protein GCM10008967_29940 [Bacillus carboniphilus]|uniref:Aspartyl-phosphate phosphatase Spo0E family protein n=1 Tax=Bacillus carboniphilus TaxID=86663 RepID=A0ABP3G6P9_9BACI